MGKSGLMRGVFAAAVLAGATYYGAHWLGVTGSTAVVWKGSGVAMLALYCVMEARSVDGWLIAAVMAFGALGDVLLETSGLTIGALAFVAGHVLAMLLYFRNGRPRTTFSQRLFAVLVVPLAVFISLPRSWVRRTWCPSGSILSSCPAWPPAPGRAAFRAIGSGSAR